MGTDGLAVDMLSAGATAVAIEAVAAAATAAQEAADAAEPGLADRVAAVQAEIDKIDAELEGLGDPREDLQKLEAERAAAGEKLRAAEAAFKAAMVQYHQHQPAAFEKQQAGLEQIRLATKRREKLVRQLAELSSVS
ncbi:MAG: hypothetical protein ACK5X3_18400 [Pseudomonadota bacterium]|jgi:hypothetical protein